MSSTREHGPRQVTVDARPARSPATRAYVSYVEEPGAARNEADAAESRGPAVRQRVKVKSSIIAPGNRQLPVDRW
jgi:hypothetical protein